MWESITQRTSLKICIFLICSAFVYAGAVNKGSFDFLPAVPFLGFIIFVSMKWRSFYAFSLVLLLCLCSYLYFMKQQQTQLFYPAIGKTFILQEDICLSRYESRGQIFVLKDDLNMQYGCNLKKADAEVTKSEILPKGSVLTVNGIDVSNADLGEQYHILTDTKVGPMAFRDFKSVTWTDGTAIDPSHLRRSIFYIPSLLMFWPVFPLLLKSLI